MVLYIPGLLSAVDSQHPRLQNLPLVRIARSATIATQTFVNTVGGALTGCEAPGLTTGVNGTGLTVSRTTNNSTCEITGTVANTALCRGDRSYSVTATNDHGTHTATISINVTGC